MSSYTPETVLITGATGDFGKAFAHKFAQTGAKLIIHGRNADKVKAVCDSLDVETYPLVFDVCDRENTLKQLENIPPSFKNIDLLINNAGVAFGQEKAQESKLEEWEAMIEINNTSLIRITKIILDDMVKRQKGHIINIGSIAGNYPYPGGHIYCAAKAFVKQFSLALRSDLQGTNIRVTNIEPGMVETQFSLVRFHGDKERADAVYANANPLQAEDIANAVFWAATCPAHMNVNRIEIMSTSQSSGALQVERRG